MSSVFLQLISLHQMMYFFSTNVEEFVRKQQACKIKCKQLEHCCDFYLKPVRSEQYPSAPLTVHYIGVKI